MNVKGVSEGYSTIPLPVVTVASLLVHAVIRIDNIAAKIITFNNQFYRNFSAETQQTFHRAITDLRQYLPQLPPVVTGTFSQLARLAGIPATDDLTAFLDLTDATRRLQTDEAQECLRQLYQPVNTPGDDLYYWLKHCGSATLAAIAQGALKELPVHLEVDAGQFSSLVKILQSAAREGVDIESNAFHTACQIFLASQIPTSDMLSSLLAHQLAITTTGSTDLISPLLAGKSPEQCLASYVTPPLHEAAVPQVISNTQTSSVVLPAYSPSNAKAVGFPDNDRVFHAYTGLQDFAVNAPTSGGAYNGVLIQPGTSMSFIKPAAHSEIPQCLVQGPQHHGALTENYPGNATLNTRFGLDSSGNNFVEVRVTAVNQLLLFSGVLPAGEGGMKSISNLLQAGDRLANLSPASQSGNVAYARQNSPSAARSDQPQWGTFGVAAADILTTRQTDEERISIEMQTLARFEVRVGEENSTDQPPQPFTQTLQAENSVTARPDTEDWQKAWEYFERLRQAKKITAPPPTADPLTLPFMLTQHTNGSLSVNHHAVVNLESYALNGSPATGALNTPLDANRTAGYYNIKTQGAAGSKVYNVALYPFPVERTLARAMRDPRLGLVELTWIAATAEKPARYSIAPDSPWLLQFLAHFYVARGVIIDSLTVGGDGVIRDRNNNMWCLIDAQPFPVRLAKDQKYFIPSPSTAYLSRKETDPAAAQKRLDDLQFAPIEVVRINGEWWMKPSVENADSLMRFVATTDLFDITPGRGTTTAHAIRFGNVTIPFEEHITAVMGHATLPAVIDPNGVLPAVPLRWYLAEGFSEKTGCYAPYDSEPDSNSIRSAFSLDTMTTRERIGTAFIILGIIMRSPLRGIRVLFQDAMGDVAARRKLRQAVLNNGWQDDNQVGTAVASNLDLAWNTLFSTNMGYYAVTAGAESFLIALGKFLRNESITTQDVLNLVLMVAFMRINQKLPSGSSVFGLKLQKSQNVLPTLRLLEKAVIEEKLENVPDLFHRNLYRHQITDTLWLSNQVEAIAGEPDFPVPLERQADLYARKIPDGVEGAQPEFYLSKAGKLHLMGKEEVDLNTYLQPASDPQAPSNLYQDPRTGWQYIRLSDESGIRTGHQAIAQHGEYFEVPDSDEVFKAENGKLRLLTPTEYLDRAQTLPPADELNGHFQKTYVINADRSREIAYEKVYSTGSVHQQNGRATYYYDHENHTFRPTGKFIDEQGNYLSLPGGAGGETELQQQWNAIKHKLQIFAVEKARGMPSFNLKQFMEREPELRLSRYINQEAEELTLVGYQVKELEFKDLKYVSDTDVSLYLQKIVGKQVSELQVSFWALTHQFHIEDFQQKIKQLNARVMLERVIIPHEISGNRININPNIDLERVGSPEATYSKSLDTRPNIDLVRVVESDGNIPPPFPKINNYGPVIRGLENPDVSRTLESSGIIDGFNGKSIEQQINALEINVTDELNESILNEAIAEQKNDWQAGKSKGIVSYINKKIDELNQDARQLLINQQLAGDRITGLLETKYDSISGWGVIAKENIEANKVIGFYSGQKLTDKQLYQKGVDHGGRLEDHMRVQSYNFETHDGYYISPVDGGNWLSLINAPDLPNGIRLGEANVASASFGKSYILFVTSKDIPKGSQLLLPYTESYDFSQVGVWRENMKNEVEDAPAERKGAGAIAVKQGIKRKRQPWTKRVNP